MWCLATRVKAFERLCRPPVVEWCNDGCFMRLYRCRLRSYPFGNVISKVLQLASVRYTNMFKDYRKQWHLFVNRKIGHGLESHERHSCNRNLSLFNLFSAPGCKDHTLPLLILSPHNIFSVKKASCVQTYAKKQI